MAFLSVGLRSWDGVGRVLLKKGDTLSALVQRTPLNLVSGIEPQGSIPDVDVGFRPLSGFDVARCLDVYVT